MNLPCGENTWTTPTSCPGSGQFCLLVYISMPLSLVSSRFACIYIYDIVPKSESENRTKGVENKVDDTLKLVVFLECAQC